MDNENGKVPFFWQYVSICPKIFISWMLTLHHADDGFPHDPCQRSDNFACHLGRHWSPYNHICTTQTRHEFGNGHLLSIDPCRMVSKDPYRWVLHKSLAIKWCHTVSVVFLPACQKYLYSVTFASSHSLAGFCWTHCKPRLISNFILKSLWFCAYIYTALLFIVGHNACELRGAQAMRCPQSCYK